MGYDPVRVLEKLLSKKLRVQVKKAKGGIEYFIVIPKSFAEALGISKGSYVVARLDPAKRRIVIEPCS